MTPGHRTTVERRHHLGLASLELVPEELAEEVVVAVPLAPAVERHHEAVCALERLERVRRPRRLEHGVAETAAHALQDRGVLEELRFGFRQPREELEAEVLGDEPVAAGKVLGTHRACRPGLHRQRREVEAGRPALGPLGQLGDLVVVELDTRRCEQQPGFLLVQPEVFTTDFVDGALRAPAGEGQRRLFPACDRDLGAGRDVPNKLGEHVQTGGLATACRSSSASTNGRSRAASAPPTRGTRVDQVDPPGPDNASKTSGETGSTR